MTKFKEGQLVEFIRESIYAKKGDRAIVDISDQQSLYGTKVKMLSPEGLFTGEIQTVYSSNIENLMKASSEIIILKEIPETEKTEINYTEESLVEAELLKLEKLDIETVKGLSLLETKILISMYSGFHPKYVDFISIEKFTEEIETEVYSIYFGITVAPHLSCELTYEEGIFDLYVETVS